MFQPRSSFDESAPAQDLGRHSAVSTRSGRAAVERPFGDLKHGYGLAPMRMRGRAKLQLHADVMLGRLGQALSRIRERAVPVAA
jgi:hypothetical protein